ncbi:MAG TPA: VWA domain-containing protein [Vicinamibacterales bacterium]|nr:VWA domain-containing protein [Vicinamibacterales bacterium]
MIPKIDLDTIRFGAPEYLWLLLAPAALFVIWCWQLSRRRRDARRYRQHRRLPVRERFPIVGGLMFWLCAIGATALTILALARPTAAVSLIRSAGVDLVILQDGSASMRTPDVPGDRWQRSIRFLRVLGESLAWKDDRIAMALFAHIAAPEVRLTKDPNTYFFFLDHLDRESPFRLEDDTTWDTNIELGIAWGLRLIEKDEEIYGKNPNAKAFVLISDGQAWSGEVARALSVAKKRDVPVWVVGVGTTVGGLIPEPPAKPTIPGRGVTPADEKPASIRSSLDRNSLAMIATAGGGEYLELDREGDREIANRIIDAARKRAGSRGLEVSGEELYWRCLIAAAALMGIGLLFLQERVELWLQAAGAAATLALIWTLTR